MKAVSCETHHRSIVKSVSYRAISVAADSAAAYFFTQDIAITAGIVLVVELYSTLLYYLHERAWAHIHFGRCPPPVR
jgi:adenylylsulfate kinase